MGALRVEERGWREKVGVLCVRDGVVTDRDGVELTGLLEEVSEGLVVIVR